GSDFYFDFVEIAAPTTSLPSFAANTEMTLATDWDTEHSLALAPERTAWMLNSLGFTGRQNHYVGALWFFELHRPGHSYSTGTVTFSGTPSPGSTVTVTIGRVSDGSRLALNKFVHFGMTASMLATAFALEFNRGYNTLWASASGSVLTLTSRTMGLGG